MNHVLYYSLNSSRHYNRSKAYGFIVRKETLTSVSLTSISETGMHKEQPVVLSNDERTNYIYTSRRMMIFLNHVASGVITLEQCGAPRHIKIYPVANVQKAIALAFLYSD